MTFAFPPLIVEIDYLVYLGINFLFLIILVGWGAGMYGPRFDSEELKHNRAWKHFTTVCVALIAFSSIPFILLIPIAAIGRYRARRSFQKSVAFMAVGMLALAIPYGLAYWGDDSGPFAGARGPARRTQCRNNLTQLGIWFHEYHTRHGQPPPSISRSENDQPISWRVLIMPEVGSGRTVAYDSTKPWNDPANLSLLEQRPASLSCPSAVDHKSNYTYYAAITGEGTLQPNTGPLSLSEVTDGISNTILLGEAAGLQIPWTEPRDISVDMQPVGINLPGSEPHHSPGWFSSYHEGGAFFTMADGSVQWFGEKIDPKILKALVTPQGGETVDLGKIMD